MASFYNLKTTEEGARRPLFVRKCRRYLPSLSSIALPRSVHLFAPDKMSDPRAGSKGLRALYRSASPEISSSSNLRSCSKVALLTRSKGG